MTVEESIAYIHQNKWTGSKPGLSRTKKLLEALGNPQDKLKFVHVVGTNGKGSFSAMLSNALIAAGYKVGTFTSPYIVRFNERIKINNKDIKDDELSHIVESLQPICDAMEDAPTEFEIITAIGMCYFAENGCDIVVLEAGMGGELDSTNVIKTPLLSVFMTINLDHMAILGDTVEKIAAAKAGILKQGTTAVIYGEKKKGAKVIIKKCKELNIPYVIPKKPKLIRTDADATVFDYKELKNICLSLHGLYQTRNAACVIEAINVLRTKGFEISEEALRDGLSSVHWPARFEIFSKNPWIIYEGAHNEDGAERLAENLKKYFKNKKFTFVMGVMRDKDYKSILKLIKPFAKMILTVTPDNPRAMKNTELAEIIKNMGIPAEPREIDSMLLSSGDTICMGSLYMYCQLLPYLEEKRMDKKKIINVAIDGPSGAGKSTIAKALASELGYGYLDTGAMYRAIALFMDRNIETLEKEVANGKIEPETQAKIVELLKDAELDVVYDDAGVQHTMVRGEDINGFIRNQKISMEASKVSAIPEVRVYLVEKQRKIGEKISIVMDGRDIGTAVLPNANVKIFLTATAEERASRRYKELIAAGQEADYDTVLREIKERDYGDMTRAVSPLKQAEDAVLLDTTNLNIEQSIEAAKKIINSI